MLITTLTPNSIAVTGLPEGAYDFEIKQMGEFFDHHYILTYKTPFGWKTFGKRYFDWNTRSEKPLTILGRANELTEEQWREMVERHDLYEGELYYNYEGDIFFTSATPSGHSLLKSKGLHVENPFRNPDATNVLGASPSGSDYEVLDELREQWQSAQELTNPLILINDETRTNS